MQYIFEICLSSIKEQPEGPYMLPALQLQRLATGG